MRATLHALKTTFAINSSFMGFPFEERIKKNSVCGWKSGLIVTLTEKNAATPLQTASHLLIFAFEQA